MNQRTNRSLAGRISTLMFAGALLVSGAMGMSYGNSDPIENNLSRAQALKLAAPIGDSGDPNIRDMPVMLSNPGVR